MHVYIFFYHKHFVINNTFGQHCYTFEAIFGMLMYPTLSFVYFFSAAVFRYQEMYLIGRGGERKLCQREVKSRDGSIFIY